MSWTREPLPRPYVADTHESSTSVWEIGPCSNFWTDDAIRIGAGAGRAYSADSILAQTCYQPHGTEKGSWGSNLEGCRVSRDTLRRMRFRRPRPGEETRWSSYTVFLAPEAIIGRRMPSFNPA